MTKAHSENFTYRIRREASSLIARFKAEWRDRRLFRWLIIALMALLVLWFAVWLLISRELPDASSLKEYEPPLPTVVRGIDGEIVHSYARERRVQLQFQDFPDPLINAYLAAEDKTFWSHSGIDLGGFIGAVIDYVSKLGSNERAVGGSTITQQVAKNILVGDEYSITRKLREMLLATRIEGVLTKREILELYLNEIPLGRRSFGVQAAARAYFDKDVGDLELHETAFLAILPKAPERYGRAQNRELAITRRNFVLDQMVENEFIPAAQAEDAKARPLGLVSQRPDTKSVDAGYFLEEVRRRLLDRYGEKADDGPNSVYAGGLWVRTSLDTELQSAARKSLRRGLLRYHGNQGWKGPIATIDFDKGPWQSQLQSSFLSINHEDWRIGVVTQRNGSNATIGFTNGEEAPLTGLPNGLKAGDVIAAAPNGNSFAVRTIPEVSGGFLAQDPHTGRILAMQGGFDSRISPLNRTVQANRQPGSTVKPFVFATALDHGMTPATLVPDKQYCYYQGSRLGRKCFTNFGGSAGGGEYPMRFGLEQSRNLMTVHIAMETGMPNVIDTFEKLNIGSYEPYPAFALGAGNSTVEKIVAGYSALVNHGRLNTPSVIDYVQDRQGKVIWRADKRSCSACNMDEWDGKAMPRFKPRGKQVMDARTAFQTVHMLEGVTTRGTASSLASLEMPLFGKTGTSSGPKDVWFVGGSPDIVAGVYLGFDQPRDMGSYAQGGSLAVPIFKQFVTESRDRWEGRPFVAPKGVRMIKIDRRTGTRVFGRPAGDDPKADVIWEAFKPDTEPRRSNRIDETEALRQTIIAQFKRGQEAVRRQTRPAETQVVETSEPETDFVEEQGGIY